MRTIHLSVSICLVAGLIGCTGRPVTRVSNTFVDGINKRLTDVQSNLSTGDAKQKRNEAIEYVVATFDANYEDFVRDIEAKRSRTNFIADVVEIGTSTAIGITKGSQRTIQIMGIALTGFRGGRKSADLNFFKEQTTAVLINQMDDGRAQIYAGMLKRMKDEDIDEYPVASAVRDLVAYYNAGTLVRAFTQLSKDTATKAQESEARVLRLKGKPLTPPATKRERDTAVEAADAIFILRKSLGGSNTVEKEAATKKLQAIVKELEADSAFLPLLKDEGQATSKETDGAKLLKALVNIRTKVFDDADLSKKLDQVIANKGK